MLSSTFDHGQVASAEDASIIPDPGSPPDVTPLTQPISVDYTGYVVSAGTQIRATGLLTVFGAWNSPITNNGVIWLDSNFTFAWLVTGGDQNRVTNTGFIYIHGQDIAELSPGLDALQNSGTIIVVSDSGWARTFWDPIWEVTVDNSGVIAVQTLHSSATSPQDSNATAIEVRGLGSTLFNRAGGSILAEAPNLAIGIDISFGSYWDGTLVDNAGVIRAHSTTADGTSIGIYLTHSYFTHSIINSGLISADIAIFATEPFLGAGSIEHIENRASGRLEGLVSLNGGDDSFINDGAVVGDVLMGDGADRYSGNGTVSGVVDLGFGDDSFAGGAANDRAAGGRGDDVMVGGAGNDILTGGFGNDTLRGGDGNDGLYGEWGNDLFVTSGGDIADGEFGDDRIVLGDLTFRLVTGGTGFDTLELPGGALRLNLSSAISSGRIAGFEAIALPGAQQVVVQAGNVSALSDNGTLRFEATSAGSVALVGNWVDNGTRLIDTVTYRVFSLLGETVLVQAGAGVAIVAGVPEGATGLDPIAPGAAAPLPGLAAGLDLTSAATHLSQFTPSTPTFTVDAQETFYSYGDQVFHSETALTLTNLGQILSVDSFYSQAIGIELHNARSSFINRGIVSVEEYSNRNDENIFYKPSLGVVMGGGFAPIGVVNSGTISVYSAPGGAIAVQNPGYLINSGTISAISEYGRAIGVNVSYGTDFETQGKNFTNTGFIYAEAGGTSRQSFVDGDSIVPSDIAATGVSTLGSIVNDGRIVATLGTHAAANLTTVGIYVIREYSRPRYGVTNNGSIDAKIAVMFDRYDPPQQQYVINNGSITGDIRFSTGTAFYDGSLGTLNGSVYAGSGDDILKGGAGTESFFGAGGNDRLTGGGGADVLSGGAGVDTFIDTAANMNGDRITDFSTHDRIVFSDATLANFTFSLSGNTLTYTGGSLSFGGLPYGTFVASAAPEGGVQLVMQSLSILLLRNGDGRLTNWLGDANGQFISNHQTALYSVPTDWKIVATADFNGDGKADILFRNDNGALTQWLGLGNGQYTWNSAATYGLSADWNVAAKGDFNGDGRADIILTNSIGLVTEWLGTADGTFVSNHVLATYYLINGWAVVGAGDFNGDGRTDLLLRHGSGTIAEWMGQADGSLDGNGLATAPLANEWKIAGIGDINGDGRDDLVLRNATSGLVVDWLGQSDGTFFSNHAATTYALPTDWTIAAVDDYNGDGRADLLLRNTNGTVTEWLGQVGGTFIWNQTALYSLSPEWHV